MCSSVDPLRQPFFGDLHVHSSFSLDADLHGTRLEPDDAYAFAKGTPVEIQPYDTQGNGLRTVTIDRPLDFAMVSDHAEFFGETSICTTSSLPGYDAPNCQAYRQPYPPGDPQHPAFVPFNFGLSTGNRYADICGPTGQHCRDEAATFWDATQNAAEAAYDRTSACSFTTFIGYEWTRSPLGQNLHRNVVFKNTEVPTVPASFFEAQTKEALWDSLEADCVGTCDFLTIPHNSNLSSGLYFDTTGYTQADAQRRQDMEPLIEVMQHKGQSECSPGSSAADEFCDFEVLPYETLAGPVLNSTGTPDPKDFVRSALKEGVRLEKELGANPFKYGMIGSTDTHLSTPGLVSEDNYPGHGGAGVPAVVEIPPGLPDIPSFNPGGLVVLWAEENSRTSLFDAMRRREAYATSGTRPVVRFFAGFGMPDVCNDAAAGYAQGVPMGSDLTLPTSYDAATDFPRFSISALQDPTGVPLERVQLIKGWVDDEGATHETVVSEYVKPGATLDTNTCQSGGTGGAQLCLSVYDVDFDPSENAFYYARILEDPTCRWHKRQCNAGGVDCAVPSTITAGFEACCDGSLPDAIQERAWSSPIWYRPEPWETSQVSSDGLPKSRVQVEQRGSIAWEAENNGPRIFLYDAVFDTIGSSVAGSAPQLSTAPAAGGIPWSLAWESPAGPDTQIWLSDHLGPRLLATNSSGSGLLNTNSGFYLAWNTGLFDLSVHDVQLNQTSSFNGYQAVASHQSVAWISTDPGTGVALFDNSTVTAVTTGTVVEHSLAIYSDSDTVPVVAWCELGNVACYAYDHSTTITTTLPSQGTVLGNSLAVGDNGLVAWVEDRGGSTHEVVVYKLGEGTVFSTDNALEDLSPALDAPYLVWEHEPASPANTRRIMVHNLEEGWGMELADTGLVRSFPLAIRPDIAGGTVVWIGAAPSGEEVFKAQAP